MLRRVNCALSSN